MTGLAVQISSKSLTESSLARRRLRPTTKNAWARYVRNRFRGRNLVKCAMEEWDLSEGQARGLVYAQASQATIDVVLDHPRGGFALAVVIIELKFEMKLEGFIQQQAEGASRERAEWEARERTLEDMRARVSEPYRLGGSDA